MTKTKAEFLKMAFETTVAQMVAKYGAIEAIEFGSTTTEDTDEAKDGG